MKTVMLVDDNRINNFVMKHVLNKVDAGVLVWDYTDPEQALTRLEEVDPQLIFLDLNMPVLNGWQFLEGMLAHNQQHKVYILTSSTSMLDRQRAASYGNVVSFLNKPLAPEMVAAILQAA